MSYLDTEFSSVGNWGLRESQYRLGDGLVQMTSHFSRRGGQKEFSLRLLLNLITT